MSKTIEWLRNRKESINRIVPIFLSIYFCLICTPYLFARIPTINNVVSNSIVAYILRLIYLFIFIVVGLIALIANKISFKWQFLLACLAILLLFILSSIISPNVVISYSTDFSSKVILKSTQVGIYTHLTSIARFTGDLVVLFFLLTVYPYCFANRNQFSIVVLPCIIIAFVGIIYSLIFERNTIYQVINNGLSPEKIVSIFHSKNAFGIFLFEGSAAATYIFFSDSRKRFKPLIILLPASLIMSLIINCKLAAACIAILFIFAYLYAIFRYFNTRKWFSITLITCLSIACLGIILFFAIPQLHSSGISKKIYDKIIEYFSKLDIGSFLGRTAEWSMVPIMCTGIFVVIGFSQSVGYNVVYSFTSIYASSSQPVSDLHNAYVDFYAYHGVIGCIFLAAIYACVIFKLCLIFKIDKAMSLLLFALLFVSILFGMAETYTLFVSMSANTFALSFLILCTTVFEAQKIVKRK